MNPFVWLERTQFAQWVHSSPSPLAFPMVLTVHVLAMGLVVGLASVLNVRLLGCIARVPLAPLTKLFPLLWAGFCTSAITGAILFIADTSTKLAAPIFYIKLVLVAFGVITTIAIRREVFQDPALDGVAISGKGKGLAVTSLLLWAAAITAARLIAYLQPRHAAFLYGHLVSGGQA